METNRSLTITSLILVVVLVTPASVAAQRFRFDSQIGVVDLKNDQICLAIQNSGLSVGDRVKLVSPFTPQRIATAVIEQRPSQPCSDNPGIEPNNSFYLLRLEGTETFITPGHPPAIGIVGLSKPVRLLHRQAIADLDRDGRMEYFRHCASNEGTHLTVWSGKPLTGKRRWHSYYYLGYDVVPNCKKKDYIEAAQRTEPGAKRLHAREQMGIELNRPRELLSGVQSLRSWFCFSEQSVLVFGYAHR